MHGNEHFQGILNQELTRIYELSTDRLVFLSGKGQNQSDIDFLIQQYREYFAANYLSNHPEADPDKVFSCLVERGAYWQQVLRFYAAIASPAVQRAWALGATAGSGTVGFLNDLRLRRAILFILPEFSRLPFEQFKVSVSASAS